MLTEKRATAAMLVAYLIAVTLLILPEIVQTPGRDSATYLFVAQGILEGKLPYADYWDHKPPLIFVIDALALTIGGGTLWGLWFLECLLLFIAFFLGFRALSFAFGSLPALFGSCAWLFSIVEVLQGGNLTEEYALPVQLLAMYCFIRSAALEEDTWVSFVIGALAAIAFLLKPNLVGLWMAIAIYLMVRRRDVRSIAKMFLGFSSVAIICASVLFSLEIADAFFDAVLHYNVQYSATTSLTRKLYSGLYAIGAFRISLVVWAGFFVAIAYALINHKQRILPYEVIAMSVLWLPIEIALAAMSGRDYGHYFIALLPVMSVFLAFFAFFVTRSNNGRQLAWLNCWHNEEQKPDTVGHVASAVTKKTDDAVILPALILAGLFICNLNIVGLNITRLFKGHGSVVEEVAQYVEETTRPDDPILVWGAESYLYFLTGRSAPTRFFYQYPLATVGYANRAIVNEFVFDIRINEPKLIVDTASHYLPPLDPRRRTAWVPSDLYTGVPQDIEAWFNLVDDRYRPVAEISGWTIYRIRD